MPDRRKADQRAGALAELASIEEQIALLRQRQHLVVRKAMTAGASWRQVGRILGVSGSTAFRRYAAK